MDIRARFENSNLLSTCLSSLTMAMEYFNKSQGYHLRVATMEFRPFNIPFFKDGRQRIYGLIGSMIDNITESLNITYHLVKSNDGEYGRIIEGTQEITGMPRTVRDGDADVATGPFPVHYLYSGVLHECPRPTACFTAVSITSGMTQEFITATQNYTEAFDSMSWIMVFASMMSAHLVIMLYNMCANKDRKMGFFELYMKWLFSMFAVILQEATAEKPSKVWYERRIQGLWLFCCMIISHMFAGSMRANLVVQQPTERINHITDVLKHPEYRIIFGGQTPAENIINQTLGETGRRLQQMMAANSEGVVPFYDLHLDRIRDAVAMRRGVVLMEKKFMRLGVSKWCKNSPYKFFFADTPLARTILTILTSKDLPKGLNNAIDMQILWVEATGVPFMNEREILDGGTLSCLATKERRTTESMEAMKLKDLDVINFSLFVGLTSGLVVFFIEIFYYYATKCVSYINT